MESTYALSRASGLDEVVRGRILAGNYFLLNDNIDTYYKKALKVGCIHNMLLPNF